MVLVMLWSNVILKPSSDLYAYKWEIVGFRAAWVSVTQLPLLYCLGGKANIISLITGISYERLNWLHRWVARSIFLTVIVHWSYFFREWWLSDFVKFEFQIMPMVKYGFGAWAVIGWSVLTGFGLFRVKGYELWVMQHLASAGVLLWLLYVHVPSYARYNIWLSIGFVVFDRGTRGLWSLIRNLHLASIWQKVARTQSVIGFNANVETQGDGFLTLTIDKVDFKWYPGQHVFISMPTCGILESHPFTISTISSQESGAANALQLYFKAHAGFTKRLLEKAEMGKTSSMRTFISGPWGNPPVAEIERCNSLVFVASSTGASFAVPLLEHAVQRPKFVQRLRFYWIVRHEAQLKVFMPRISKALELASQLNIDAEARIFITQSYDASVSSQASNSEKTNITCHVKQISSPSSISEAPTDDSITQTKQLEISRDTKDIVTEIRSVSSASQSDSLRSSDVPENRQSRPPVAIFCQGRPQSWDELIHPTIVEAEGETAVIACGGRALMADIRNYVAWISDERAVHKGTGAQGIFLHTETYGW